MGAEVRIQHPRLMRVCVCVCVCVVFWGVTFAASRVAGSGSMGLWSLSLQLVLYSLDVCWMSAFGRLGVRFKAVSGCWLCVWGSGSEGPNACEEIANLCALQPILPKFRPKPHVFAGRESLQTAPRVNPKPVRCPDLHRLMPALWDFIGYRGRYCGILGSGASRA